MQGGGLAVLDLFSDLPGDQVRRVAEQAHIEVVPAGRVIVEAGRPSDGFYLIADGAVDVVRGGAVVNRLGTGAFFGEMGAMEAGPGPAPARTASIVAATETRVVIVPSELVTELLATNPTIRDRVYAVMSRRGEA